MGVRGLRGGGQLHQVAERGASRPSPPSLPPRPTRAPSFLIATRSGLASQEARVKGYGRAYAAFGGGVAGLEACVAIEALCEVSAIDKLLSAFIMPLQGDAIATPDRRVHCSLNLNTETGRLSARRPNLQNQPALEKDRYKVRALRYAIKPPHTIIHTRQRGGGVSGGVLGRVRGVGCGQQRRALKTHCTHICLRPLTSRPPPFTCPLSFFRCRSARPSRPTSRPARRWWWRTTGSWSFAFWRT